jgi:hypothetical protein
LSPSPCDPPSRSMVFLWLAFFPPRGISLLWNHPSLHNRIPWWTYAAVSVWMWILIPIALFSWEPDAVVSAQEQRDGSMINQDQEEHSTPDHGTEFTDPELRVIDEDPTLRTAHSMGHLNREQLHNYIAMKLNYEDRRIPRKLACVCLLFMVPSTEWNEVARQRGMSRTEYRDATNFVLSTAEGYELDDRQAYEECLGKYTGKRLADY